MLDEKKILLLDRGFQRIFATPITRMTFRQLQNIIYTVFDGDQEKSVKLLESLLTGEAQDKLGKDLKKLIEKYSLDVAMAKEVQERGDFMAMLTSDLLPHTNQAIFSNRVKRVDGEEFHFITDFSSVFRLIDHFIGRVEEVKDRDQSQKIVAGYSKELEALKKRLDSLI